MTSKNWIYSCLMVCLCLGDCLLFVGCSEDDPKVWMRPEELTTVDAFIKEGVLLQSVQETDDSYLFSFENGNTLKLPYQAIKEFQQYPDKWMTVLTLSNDQEYNIPTVGNSIEQFVKEIKLNPSGFNPLAVSIQMELPAKGCMKVKVYAKKEAKTADQEYQYKFVDNYTQDVTVLGLYENYSNQIELTYLNKEGDERGKTILEASVKPLNIKRLPKHKLLVSKQDKTEPGMILVACPGEEVSDTSIPYMIDDDGEVRWLLDWESSEDLKHIGAQCGLSRLKNGHYIIGNTTDNRLLEIDILGNVLRQWNLSDNGYGFHHEVIENTNGNFLVTAHKNGATCEDKVTSRVNDFIIEVNPNGGSVTQSWDLTNTLDSARYIPTDPSLPGAATGQSKANWAHNNAIVPMDGGNYLASARFQGIFKYNVNGELLWIISPHKNWRPEYQKYLLTPMAENGDLITDQAVIDGEKSGEEFDWAWGVHNPVLMPNGHILAFDNGYGRNFKVRPFSDRTQYSRIVEYEVDEVNRTVRQVWEYGKDRHECYAPAYSGVQYQEKTGNYLFAPGMQNVLSDGGYGARIIEINPKNKEVVYEIEIHGQCFRANRLSLYPEGL